MTSRSMGSSQIKQVPFGIIDFFEIRVIRDRFDPFLQRNDFIVASHHNDRRRWTRGRDTRMRRRGTLANVGASGNCAMTDSLVSPYPTLPTVSRNKSIGRP